MPFSDLFKPHKRVMPSSAICTIYTTPFRWHLKSRRGKKHVNSCLAPHQACKLKGCIGEHHLLFMFCPPSPTAAEQSSEAAAQFKQEGTLIYGNPVISSLATHICISLRCSLSNPEVKTRSYGLELAAYSSMILRTLTIILSIN